MKKKSAFFLTILFTLLVSILIYFVFKSKGYSYFSWSKIALITAAAFILIGLLYKHFSLSIAKWNSATQFSTDNAIRKKLGKTTFSKEEHINTFFEFNKVKAQSALHVGYIMALLAIILLFLGLIV